MTEKTVVISIIIKAFEKEIEYQREVQLEEMEGEIGEIVQGIGQEVLRVGIEAMDKRISKEVPKGWRNVGTEERGMLSSLGAIRYKRRIYMDETGIRRKPIDEVLGVERYGRDSQTVREMGAYLACEGTYRRAASQLSWLVKAAVSHSTIQRMVWQVGKRIADGEDAERERVFGIGERIEKGKVKVPVLYGESDGVWLHLQREGKKSVEVRVATLYSGKKLIGKKRYGLENKCVVTSIDETSAAWHEHLLWKAHRYYDLETAQLLITGGDGNQWVRRSFDRFEIKQKFVLDRFHYDP